MSVEGWKEIFDWGTVILLFLTFAFGAGIVITGGILGKQAEEQSRQFEKDLTEAKTKLGEQQERAAIAEKSLKDVDTKTEGFRLAIAQANERAAKAQESLALAEQHSVEANAKAESFRLDIAKANESARQAEARAAEANRKAEEERIARVKLEIALAPRYLTVAQGEVLVVELRKFANQKFVFVTYQDDKEAIQFAEQINAVLQAAGWKVEQSKGFLAFALEFNLSVMVDPKASEETKKAADTFIRAFNKQGVPTGSKLAQGDTGEPDTIQVRVGKKP